MDPMSGCSSEAAGLQVQQPALQQIDVQGNKLTSMFTTRRTSEKFPDQSNRYMFSEHTPLFGTSGILSENTVLYPVNSNVPCNNCDVP